MEESLEFLSKIFDLLVDGDVFDTRSNEPKSVVDFHHPAELKVIWSLLMKLGELQKNASF